MISRSIDALVMLAGGLALGWLLVSPEEHRAAVESRVAAVEAPAARPASPPPATASTTPVTRNCPKPDPVVVIQSPAGTPPLPAIYVDMLGVSATLRPGQQ